MIYHAYKGIGLSFISEKTNYMHLRFVSSFTLSFDLDVKTSDLLGKSSKEMSDLIDESYVRALTITHASEIRLRAESIAKNCICQFGKKTNTRIGETIRWSLVINIYQYSRSRLISQLDWNNNKINKMKMELNELSSLSIFKKRKIIKDIYLLERKNDYLLTEQLNKYKDWLSNEFVVFKLSILLLEELMQYVTIYSKKDIVKTFVLLDTIVEKFYSFNLSAKKVEIGNMQLMIDSSVAEFTNYIERKIEELRSFNIGMIHGEMLENLDEEEQQRLNEFKKAFFNEQGDEPV